MTTKFYPGWKDAPIVYTYSFNIREKDTNEFLFVCEDWRASPEEYIQTASDAAKRVADETGKVVYIEDVRKKHRLK